MSWSETVVSASSSLRGVAVALFAAGMLAASGCTVQPLYGETTASVAPSSAQGRVADIAVAQVGTRYGQEVRNHLIFGFHGGAGEPADPLYRLSLAITKTGAGTVSIQNTTRDNEPTAGAIKLVADYVLTEAASGKVVATGSRSATAQYDIPYQLFAAQRAELDAENRAARELAAFLQLSVMQDLSRI